MNYIQITYVPHKQVTPVQTGVLQNKQAFFRFPRATYAAVMMVYERSP